MNISTYYLDLTDATVQNPVTMNVLNLTKDFKYMPNNLVDALVFSGELKEMSEPELQDVDTYKENGYRVSLKGNSPDTLTKFPFVSRILHKKIIFNIDLTDLELNTLYKLGYIRQPDQGDTV